MKLNNLNTIIKNSTYGTIQNYIDGINNQFLFYNLQNVNILTFNPYQVVMTSILQEFLLRVPYNQNLEVFSIRFIGIINKFTANILNYCVKLQQQQNFLSMLAQNQAKTITSKNDLSTNIKTNNTTNEASGQSFSPTADGSIDLNLSQASSMADVTAANVRSGTIANSNFNTNQDQTQTVNHTMTEQDLIIYNTLKFEADNILQPILTALNSLFYVFEQEGNNNDYWCF